MRRYDATLRAAGELDGSRGHPSICSAALPAAGSHCRSAAALASRRVPCAASPSFWAAARLRPSGSVRSSAVAAI